MHDYEVHILRPDGRDSIVYVEFNISGVAAIRAARKMAAGQAFEVWRGTECIYSTHAEQSPTPETGHGVRA